MRFGFLQKRGEIKTSSFELSKNEKFIQNQRAKLNQTELEISNRTK